MGGRATPEWRAAVELGKAYAARDRIPDLEARVRELTDEVPEHLAQLVSAFALYAVKVALRGGTPSPCPWDPDDPDWLRSGLARMWWDKYSQFWTDALQGHPFPG